MDLPDNNVLINAFRPDARHHQLAKDWLEDAVNSGRPLRLFPSVELGFLRVVTHPGVFDPPSPPAEGFSFLQALQVLPSVEIAHWSPEGRERWAQLWANKALIRSGGDKNLWAIASQS